MHLLRLCALFVPLENLFLSHPPTSGLLSPLPFCLHRPPQQPPHNRLQPCKSSTCLFSRGKVDCPVQPLERILDPGQPCNLFPQTTPRTQCGRMPPIWPDPGNGVWASSGIRQAGTEHLLRSSRASPCGSGTWSPITTAFWLQCHLPKMMPRERVRLFGYGAPRLGTGCAERGEQDHGQGDIRHTCWQQ